MENAKPDVIQVAVVVGFAFALFTVSHLIYRTTPIDTTQLQQTKPVAATTTIDADESERCKVPDFAKALGHEEKWKLHHNCK